MMHNDTADVINALESARNSLDEAIAALRRRSPKIWLAVHGSFKCAVPLLYFMRRCAAALLRNSSTELRYNRLCPCVYARLRFGALIRRCTQSLILVAAKSFRSRTPRFNKTIRTVADFPSADRLLGCPRKIISVVYKTKTPN